jgi:hypothetical protein
METGRWRILPISVVDGGKSGPAWVKGKWTGDYESAEAAVAAIDEPFLQDPALWYSDD